MLKINSFMFALAFLCLITFPGVLTIIKASTGKEPDRQLNGNFDPVAMPQFGLESVMNKSFQNGFENYFHNTFTGRGYLITTYNQLRASLFEENSSNVIGDSMIFEPYIMTHLGIDALDYNDPERFAQMEAYVDKLQSISRMLEKNEKSLIFVSASGKAAWLEDGIPRRYYLMPQGLGASDCLDGIIQSKDILYLNCDQYLEKIDFCYPVFYKSSHHWSRTAEIEIENAIFDIINSETPFSVETYRINGIVESPTPIDRDADTWSLMNLWIPTKETYYAYDITVNPCTKPTNILIQGDSYTSLIASDMVQNGHNGTVSNIDYDNAYYVNGECVSLLGHDFSVLDMDEIVSRNDIFIILYTDYNLPSYGFGFVDALYECLNNMNDAEGGV